MCYISRLSNWRPAMPFIVAREIDYIILPNMPLHNLIQMYVFPHILKNNIRSESVNFTYHSVHYDVMTYTIEQ